MANGKYSRNLLDKARDGKSLSSNWFDRSITLALLSLIMVSWFINHFLIT